MDYDCYVDSIVPADDATVHRDIVVVDSIRDHQCCCCRTGVGFDDHFDDDLRYCYCCYRRRRHNVTTIDFHTSCCDDVMVVALEAVVVACSLDWPCTGDCSVLDAFVALQRMVVRQAPSDCA